MFHTVVNRLHVDYAALLWWDVMNNVFQRKEVIQYPRFIKLIIVDLMKKFPNIPKRQEEEYHTIKDDAPLSDDFKAYETAFVGLYVSMKQPQLVVSTQGTHRKKKQSTPSIPPPGDDVERDAIAEASLLSLTLYKTQENIAKVKEAFEQEEIDKLVDGDEDEESYASEFDDSMFNDDVDDSKNKVEPGSHKEHPENVSDDETKVTEKVKEKEIVEKEK
ncbi:hypothetical protein Tco_0845614 [Tanacetum coccineum]